MTCPENTYFNQCLVAVTYKLIRNLSFNSLSFKLILKLPYRVVVLLLCFHRHVIYMMYSSSSSTVSHLLVLPSLQVVLVSAFMPHVLHYPLFFFSPLLRSLPSFPSPTPIYTIMTHTCTHTHTQVHTWTHACTHIYINKKCNIYLSYSWLFHLT